MGLIRFMASPAGRLLRVVAGAVLLYVGIGPMSGATGWIVAAVGLVAILAGALNFCLLGPLFRAPFWGRNVKAA